MLEDRFWFKILNNNMNGFEMILVYIKEVKFRSYVKIYLYLFGILGKVKLYSIENKLVYREDGEGVK